jgi:hypothetical protein
MLDKFTLMQVFKISILILFGFNLMKFIKNLRKKMAGKSQKEGMKNNLESTTDDKIKTTPTSKLKNIPQPANLNIVSQYTGIARRSGEFNNKIFNKLEDQTNRLLIKDYGDNYLQILDRFEYLLTLKMLDNTLNVDFNDDKQMMSQIEKINKFGDVKKFIDEMKQIVLMDFPNED